MAGENSTATVGYGSTISYGTDGSSYTPVAQTVDLGGPEPEVGAIDITNNDSPDNTKETIPGMIDPGTMDFDVVYKGTACAALYGMLGDGVIYYWKETYPDGASWTFKGFITKFGTEGKTEDDKITNTITIQLTSKPVYAAGS